VRRIVVRLILAVCLGTTVAGASAVGAAAAVGASPDQPVVVAPKIAAGLWHTMAIKTDGSLWAWGLNANGQLGIGGMSTSHHSSVYKVEPTRVGKAMDWANVACGENFTLALKSDGSLWTWGWNQDGQLGDGTTETSYSPVRIGTDTDWVRVDGGFGHTIALKSDGSLWAWGANWEGQCGLGTTDERIYTPTRVGTDNDWVAFTCGWGHTVAIKSDGSLWAWGRISEIGPGGVSYEYIFAPRRLYEDNDWVAVACGRSLTMGLKSDGSLYNLGEPPVRIGTENDWAAIAGGEQHTLATKNDGSLWAWGSNFYGQLGDGSTVDSPSPIRISTRSDWVGLAAMYNHSVAVGADGSLYSWGLNSYGQLGDGTTIDRNSPTFILGLFAVKGKRR